MLSSGGLLPRCEINARSCVFVGGTLKSTLNSGGQGGSSVHILGFSWAGVIFAPTGIIFSIVGARLCSKRVYTSLSSPLALLHLRPCAGARDALANPLNLRVFVALCSAQKSIARSYLVVVWPPSRPPRFNTPWCKATHHGDRPTNSNSNNSSARTVPVQCPYSARTVPVQCPL